MSDTEPKQPRLPRATEGVTVGDCRRWKQERDEARAKANEWHRRAQKAEAVVAKGIENQVCQENSGNVGRALANVMAWHYKDEADRLKRALVAMGIQYLTDHDNPLHFNHSFMSAGEAACEVLCEVGAAEPDGGGCILTNEAYDEWADGL